MDATQLRRALVQQLESLGRAGVRDIPKPLAAVLSLAAPAPVSRAAELPAAPLEPSTTDLGEMAAKDKTDSLSHRRQALRLLAETIAGCTRCRELADSRTQTVFGVGDPQAEPGGEDAHGAKKNAAG